MSLDVLVTTVIIIIFTAAKLQNLSEVSETFYPNVLRCRPPCQDHLHSTAINNIIMDHHFNDQDDRYWGFMYRYLG